MVDSCANADISADSVTVKSIVAVDSEEENNDNNGYINRYHYRGVVAASGMRSQERLSGAGQRTRSLQGGIEEDSDQVEVSFSIQATDVRGTNSTALAATLSMAVYSGIFTSNLQTEAKHHGLTGLIDAEATGFEYIQGDESASRSTERSKGLHSGEIGAIVFAICMLALFSAYWVAFRDKDKEEEGEGEGEGQVKDESDAGRVRMKGHTSSSTGNNGSQGSPLHDVPGPVDMAKDIEMTSNPIHTSSSLAIDVVDISATNPRSTATIGETFFEPTSRRKKKTKKVDAPLAPVGLPPQRSGIEDDASSYFGKL